MEYIHRAWLGSADYTTDANGMIRSYAVYDEWGAPRVGAAHDLNLAGLDATAGFTSYTYDKVIGVWFAQLRFYDPVMRRFTQEDPIRSGLNWYAYCGNNPVMFIDPWGLDNVLLRNWIESRGGSVNPIQRSFLGIDYGLKQVDVTFEGKTITYTSSDYKITGGRAYIDDSQLYNDFGTAGVGAARAYREVKGGAAGNYVNCYAFAIGYSANAQPGWKSGKSIDYSKPYPVDIVASYDISDLTAMGRGARIIDGSDAAILSNERRIAVRVGTQAFYDSNGVFQGYDYHFMVQNSDGTWSEKHGPGGTSISHCGGGTPDTIPWTLGDKPYYDSKIIYIAITN